MQITNQKEIVAIEEDIYEKLQPEIDAYIDRITKEEN